MVVVVVVVVVVGSSSRGCVGLVFIVRMYSGIFILVEWIDKNWNE